MVDIAISPTDADLAQGVLEGEHTELYRWFSADYSIKPDTTMVKRCKRLGVPYQVGCDVDSKLSRLAGLIALLGDVAEGAS